METEQPSPPVPLSESASVPNSLPPTAGSPAATSPAYRDRSTGLTVFGVFQVILGIMAGLMIPLGLLGAVLSRLGPGGTMHPRQIISGLTVYLFVAVALVTLGIGSVQARRWARALTLVTSWYGLAVGVLVTVLLTAVLPVTVRSALAQAQPNAAGAPSPEISIGVMAVIVTMIIVFAAFFLVLVPVAYVIFYIRTDVAETCRRRDPVERWTDRTPLPVLGASVVFAVGAAYMLVVAASTPLFPFFGRYLTGIAGAGCFLVLAALDAYLAYALFRLQSSGWWIAMCALFIRLVSMAITYARADLMQAYSRIGFSDAELRMLNANPMIRSRVILWWSLFSVVALFGYLIWIKRYFKTPPAPLTADPLAMQTD